MRELKFRAWDKKRKCYAKHIMTTNTSCPYHDRMNVFKGVITFAKWILHRYIIEQYTGLKDKNGKEIYEGDIVKNIDSDLGDVGIIKFSEKLARFSVYWGMNPYMAKEIHLNGMFIVGNIHENPELLGNEDKK